MMMNRALEILTRRGALAAAAAAGAMAAVASRLSANPMPSARLQPIPIGTGQRPGYRVSEHVQRYYRSTLF
jgi:hypothetical protein